MTTFVIIMRLGSCTCDVNRNLPGSYRLLPGPDLGEEKQRASDYGRRTPCKAGNGPDGSLGRAGARASRPLMPTFSTGKPADDDH